MRARQEQECRPLGFSFKGCLNCSSSTAVLDFQRPEELNDVCYSNSCQLDSLCFMKAANVCEVAFIRPELCFCAQGRAQCLCLYQAFALPTTDEVPHDDPTLAHLIDHPPPPWRISLISPLSDPPTNLLIYFRALFYFFDPQVPCAIGFCNLFIFGGDNADKRGGTETDAVARK